MDLCKGNPRRARAAVVSKQQRRITVRSTLEGKTVVNSTNHAYVYTFQMVCIFTTGRVFALAKQPTCIDACMHAQLHSYKHVHICLCMQLLHNLSLVACIPSFIQTVVCCMLTAVLFVVVVSMCMHIQPRGHMRYCCMHTQLSKQACTYVCVSIHSSCWKWQFSMQIVMHSTDVCALRVVYIVHVVHACMCKLASSVSCCGVK